ncbi:50S ribosomal protein L23 [Candidatus Microgenomates bacterium]|nr:50S ribosomal protein L23 [Candidatus Microgenomates bacterium]
MNTLISPIVSEKSMQDAALNKYTFRVDKDANKAKIYTEIVNTFNVKPVSIRTVVVKGKTVINRKTRNTTKTESWKKAIVELKKGEKIDLFDVSEKGHTHHA